MTPEQRGQRIAELQRQTSREWLRYMVLDGAIIVVVAAVLIVGVLTDALSESAIVPIAIVGGVLCGALVTYWLLARIRPLQLERERIEQLDGITSVDRS